jgi:hypothetical protein
MKIKWEEKDIIAGKIVCKEPSYQGNENFKACGNSAKWTLKIGFAYYNNIQYFVTVALTDGMVSKIGKTKKEVVEYLNKSELIPMPHSWLIEIINYLRDIY